MNTEIHYRHWTEELMHNRLVGSVYFTRHGGFDFTVRTGEKLELKSSKLHQAYADHGLCDWREVGRPFYQFKVSARQILEANRVILLAIDPNQYQVVACWDIPTNATREVTFRSGVKKHLWYLPRYNEGFLIKIYPDSANRLDVFKISFAELIERYC